MTTTSTNASWASRLAAPVGAGCLLLAVLGLAAAGAYSETPGARASTHAHAPDWASTLERGRVATLLVFAHPGCPCTEATGDALADLARAWHPGDVVVHVIVSGPAAHTVELRSATRRALASLPDVRFKTDPDGALARDLGVRTSGHVVSLDADARVTFSGGITPGRGHRGAAAGLDALRHLTTDAAPHASHQRAAPVFGCPIFDDDTPRATAPPCPLCTDH